MVLPIIIALGACGGTISDPAVDDGAAGAAGSTGGARAGGATTSSTQCQSGGVQTPPVRRLTNAEYTATLTALLGELPSSVAGVQLPRDKSAGHYETNVELQTTTSDHLTAYATVAELVADHIVASATRRRALLGCDPTGEARANCLRTFATQFGRRAFRQPVPSDDLDALMTLANGQQDVNDAVRIVIMAVLQAPRFLYRAEMGVAEGGRSGLRPLTGYEVATRLSYLLWGTTPSDDLLDQAASGALDDADGVATAAERMLQDPRARAATRSFFSQWLSLDKLNTLSRDPKKYPAWNLELGRSMREQTLRTIEAIAWEGSRRFADILDADFTMIDERLAPIYGRMSGGAEWTRLGLSPESKRAGLIAQPSILSITAKDGGPSPILRGKFIREVLLCETLPIPPANIPELTAPVAGESERQRLARHRDDPSCSSCHKLLEPLGFALSHFDGIGRWRDKDDFGQAIVSTGSLSGFDAPEFDGAAELAERLANSDEAKNCPAKQFQEFALGRRTDLTGVDQCAAEELTNAFAMSNYDLRALFRTYVRSDAFRLRSQ